MTVGASSSTGAAYLSAVFQGTPFSLSALWAQKHVGDPGADGTANPATDTDRVDVSACFGTDPALVGSFQQITNDAEMGPWPPATAAETPTHLTFWGSEGGSDFAGSGTVTAAALAIGDPFSVPVGDCVIKTPVAT